MGYIQGHSYAEHVLGCLGISQQRKQLNDGECLACIIVR